jgi:hypothetical protein
MARVDLGHSLVSHCLRLTRQARALELTRLNTSRPDRISSSKDGVKSDGPKRATALVPWIYLKGCRKGRRVVLVEQSDKRRYVMLPVAKLSDVERLQILQFLQSHIA